MAYSFRHTSPELAGVLVKEKVRCGRPNCRCMRLKQLHGWYCYLYWRDYANGSKLRKRYVPKIKVKELNQRLELAKAEDIKEKQEIKMLTKWFNQNYQ